MTPPRVTAIVVVHGSPATTVDACIESLLASTAIDLYVVLIDNASPDGGAACARWADDHRVLLIRSTRNDGFAAGVNQGLRARRRGDLVWLLNDDATVADDCIARCTALLVSDSSAVAIAPRVMLANEVQRVDSVGVVLRSNGEAFNAFIGQIWADQVANGSTVFGPCFAAVLMRSDAFDDDVVGVLDERYRLYYEDIDWALRARRSGLRTRAATDALVWHQHAASTRLLGEPARYELVQRNLLLCATKNLSLQSVWRIWRTRLVVQAKGVMKGPMRWRRIRAVGGALVGAPSALRARGGHPVLSTTDELQMFAFADGMTPQFSVETYGSLGD